MELLQNLRDEIGKMHKRQLVMQGINLGLIITSALMIWKTLILGTGSESPVVVVLSGSMEPGFYRGDILFLYQPRREAVPGALTRAPLAARAHAPRVQAGDIVVFNTDKREIPIVHRIIKVHERAGNASRVDILTKGDNNWGDDRSLYPKGQLWLNRGHIMGKVVGFLPYVGRVTIIMNDFPMVKYALIANLRDEIGKMHKRQLVMQGINLGLIITSALMIWKTLILGTGSESPVVVVLSGSMEPGFYRGDILFLYQPRREAVPGALTRAPLAARAHAPRVQAGDIVVFNTDKREIPIVHRIIKVHERAGNAGQVDILTKGDNNPRDDHKGHIYPKGQPWLNRGHIMGKVVGFLPYVGRVTIIMNDFPMIKYALIAVLGLFVITSKE
eukprot:scaffold2.g7335.t1